MLRVLNVGGGGGAVMPQSWLSEGISLTTLRYQEPHPAPPSISVQSWLGQGIRD